MNDVIGTSAEGLTAAIYILVDTRCRLLQLAGEDDGYI